MIQQAQERPSYGQLAQANSKGVVSTILPKPKSSSTSPSKGTANDANNGFESANGSPIRTLGLGKPPNELQKELDGIVTRVEHTRSKYEAAMLAASKAAELTKSMENEIK